MMIITSSPNSDGLTTACAKASMDGFNESKVDSREVRLTDHLVGRCKQCDNGWGTCLNEHRCQVQDDFQRLHASLLESDAVVLITPVYWGDFSESMKAFCDRLRRCEALRNDESPLHGKWLIGVAAAGGGGGGVTSCFSQFEQLASHLHMRKFDYLGVTQRSREYMVPAIRESAKALSKAMSVR